MLNQELEELINKIADGDESALAVLYDRTNKLLFSLVMRMLGDAATAEEVLVKTYTTVWKQAPLFDSNHNSALAWLISIARADAAEQLPAKNNSPKIDVPPESLCGEIAHVQDSDADFISQRSWQVTAITKELLPEQQQIIALAYFSCLNQKEIADRLGFPLETVKLQLREGMIKLREQLGNSRNMQ
jgi:RNA polymerase sigma-70 factor (ECF subfamily)